MIDGEALHFNLEMLRRIHKGIALFPVLKANAYGHGADLIAKLIEARFTESAVPFFCVARVVEGRTLRKQGATRKLLVLSHFSAEDFEDSLGGFPSETEVTVNDMADVKILASIPASQRRGLTGVHLNLNTGMNRLGFRVSDPAKDAATLLEAARALHAVGITVTGLLSHLACGEESPEKFSNQQWESFETMHRALKNSWKSSEHGPFPVWIHMSNSGGLAQNVGSSLCNAARPGIHLWGIPVVGSAFAETDLRPVMQVQAPVRQIFRVESGQGIGYGQRFGCERVTLVGTVGLGYADGVDRRLSRFSARSKGSPGFVIGGVVAPVLGTVSMDMTMVDLTDHPQAEKWMSAIERGERPFVWASWICAQQPVEQLAQALGTISYEVLCSVGHRMPRRLLESAESLDVAESPT